MPLRSILAVFISSLIFCLQPAPGQSEYDPGLPFAWLFDTQSQSSSPLPGKALADKDSWKLVAEDNLDHAFKGDAVLLNDRLAVVLRARGPGAEVYSLVDGRFVNRAVLASVPEADTPISLTGLASIGILENSPASVVLRAAFETSVAAKKSSATIGITTGQPMVEMCPKSGADRLFAWYRPRWVVVPDFFGHDMVFDPQTVTSTRFGLPAENFSLGLIHGNAAMMMAVWKSGRRRSHLIPPAGDADPTVSGYEIDGVEDEPVWFAFFEGPRLWHQQIVAVGQAGHHVSLDFHPPFEGRWRADLAGPSGVAHSSYFFDGKATLPGFKKGSGTVVRSTPRAVPATVPDPFLNPAEESAPLPIIVYPLDRTRATPLSAFCPTDVIRNTLGVGPCQYVLQTEGLDTQNNPTPDQVMTWVERQVQRNKTQETAHEIKELLAQMAEHVQHAQERIDRYARFSREVGEILASDQVKRGSHLQKPLARFNSLLYTAARLQAVVSENQPNHPEERARALAKQVVQLIAKPDSLDDCRRLGDELRQIGAQQDSTLSRSRMIVRWLREQASILSVDHPEFAESAQKVLEACRRQLESR